VTVLTTCAEDHATWVNTLPPGTRQVGDVTVHFFPVDEDRDLERFQQVQVAISRGGRVTRADQEAWLANNVNSTAMYDHLRTEGAGYDRIVLGPYLFGLVFHAAAIHPGKSVLVPCLHDESFAYLEVMKDLFGSVGGFMFNTEPERDLARRLFDLPPERCPVVGMGIDTFDADPDAAARKFSLPEPYLLYSGRREPLKGTPLLLDYLDTFRDRTGRDVNLVLTGSGSFDPPPNLAPHVRDLGFLSEADKHAVMAGALAFCHPSVNESLGIVLLEAWLARTPALVHGLGEVLTWQCRRSGGGLWFRTYPEFEEALLRLLDDEPLRRALGEAGRRYVLEQYAWAAVEERMFAALDGEWRT
jgi:glycosyltransferase involved in cell wall biosynthesis